MTVVGLSGKYCAGKSTLAAALVQKGATEIDVDTLGHEVLESCRAQVIEAFGNEIVKPDGSSIDRAALGRRVFAEPKELSRLEAILHPALYQRVVTLLEEARKDASIAANTPSTLFKNIILVNAALLFKMKLDLLCDVVIWVQAPWFVRLLRGLRRDSRGFWQTVQLMQRQNTLGPQHRSGNADIVKVHSQSDERFFARLSAILEQYHG